MSSKSKRGFLFTNLIFVFAGAGVLAAQDTSATVSGQLLDWAEAVIPGIDAELRLHEPPYTLFSVRMDQEGKFRFSVLPPGVYTLNVSRIGFRTLTLRSIQVARGEQKILPTLRLDVAPSGCGGGPVIEYIERLPKAQNVGDLRGRVMRDERHPIPRVTVTLHCEERPICGQTKTDINGEFFFFNLAPDDLYTIRFSRQGFYPWQGGVYEIQPGYDATYGAITLEHCPSGNCDPRLRPKRPLVVCE
jgi:hypothetical protein